MFTHTDLYIDLPEYQSFPICQQFALPRPFFIFDTRKRWSRRDVESNFRIADDMLVNLPLIFF